MKPKKLFGTDGIRGVANQFPMTPEIALKVGRAIAHKVKTDVPRPQGVKPKIFIGKDTRLSGYMLEQALSSGICSMGVNSFLVGPLPTPGIAFLTHNMRADAGIVISASHNPFQDNGIKIFGRDGFKFTPQEEKSIEELVLNNDFDPEMPTAEGVGKTYRIDDAIGRYVVYVKNTFPKLMTLQGLRIVLDCGNGAAYKVAPWVFEEFGAEVIRLGVNPNGLNINDKCGALYPDNICKAVLEYRADIGISLDGDADRVILCDEKGKVVNGDHILAICALDMFEKKELTHNTVVATHMSNIGLEQCLKKQGIKLLKTDVGDKYVVDAMRQGGLVLGGEQSGHLIFLNSSTTGDGLVAALRVLAVMVAQGKQLSTLKKVMKDVPQVLRNVRVSRRADLDKISGLSQLVESIEGKLNGSGRVFLRASGTEPVFRILVEGPQRELIDDAAEQIASLIQKELG